MLWQDHASVLSPIIQTVLKPLWKQPAIYGNNTSYLMDNNDDFDAWLKKYHDRFSASDKWDQFCALGAAEQKNIFVSLLSVIEAFNDCSDDLEFYKYAWRMKVQLSKTKQNTTQHKCS